jgi:hypothetical protein
MDVSELLAIVVAHDEAGGLFFDKPGRREAAALDQVVAGRLRHCPTALKLTARLRQPASTHMRASIGCRKHRHGDQDIRGDARDMEILIWSQCEFVEAQRHTNRPSLRIT